MKLQLERLIGTESRLSLQHRILSMVSLFGLALSILSGIGNYLLSLGPAILLVSIAGTIFSLLLYYLSVIKRQYSLPMLLLVFICIFVFTPVMWLFNGGTQGPTSLFILFFSSVTAALIQGTKRLLTLGLLLVMSIGLIGMEYVNSGWILPYDTRLDRYIDLAFGLLLIMVTNSALIAWILQYYIREHDRSNEYRSQIEKQQMKIIFQNNLQEVNQQLELEIDERKQAEQALRRSEERFAKTFLVNPVPMCIIAPNNGLLDINKSFETIFQYQLNEIVGKTPTMLNIGTDLENCLAEVMDKGKAVYNQEISFSTKSGAERTGLLSIELIEIHGERWFLCAINDITDRIHLEKEITHLDRLNLIGEMAASLGHEVRNPLTTVRGFLQLFQAKTEYAAQKEYFSLMIEELDRANSIITEFLSLAKNKKIDLAPNDLNAIIRKLFPLLQADALRSGKAVSIELNDIPDILLDENEIRQCILNLVRNGLEAIKPKGTVTIKTRLAEEYVMLEIHDDGEGIPPEIVAKFGTPFVTTKDKGTGLGIPICYQIVKRHHAEIKVDTGQTGTTFTIRFNRA